MCSLINDARCMQPLATGGYTQRDRAAMAITVLPAGTCPAGHRLYTIGDDPRPQHVVPAVDIRAGDTTLLDCQRAMDGNPDAPEGNTR